MLNQFGPTQSFLQSMQRRQQRKQQGQPQQPAQQYSGPNPWQQAGLDPTQQQDPNQQGSKDQAISGIRYASQQILGRDLSEQELNQAAGASGYSGSGNVTGDQYNKALAYVNSLKAQQPQPQVAQGTPYGSAPGTAPNTQQAGNVSDDRAYKPSILPPHMQVNNPVTPFNAPNFSQMEGGVDALINKLLANPESLNEQTINQLKAKSKEGALSQFEQLKGQAQNDLASRGFSAAGGTQAAANAQLDMGLIDSLINSNRDIDLMAAERNRGDILNVLQAAEGAMGGKVGRASELYRTGLAGQMAEQDFGLKRWMAEQDAAQASSADQRAWADFDYGKARDDRQMLLQEFLGKSGVDLDYERLDQQADQFETATQMDLQRFLESMRQFNAQFGENQRQFNNNSALNWTNMNNQQQQSLFRYLEGLGL